MGVFPVLDYEQKVQLGDKTRLNGEKCFVTPAGAMSLTTMTVAPGLGATAEDIFSATVEERYLDWIFNTWNFDIITSVNDRIDFNDGGVKVATLAQGTYTLAQLCTEIASKLNAVGGITGAYAVSANEKDKITISNDTTSFELLGRTGVNLSRGLLPHIGFLSDATDSSHLGKRVEYSMKQVTISAGNGSSTTLTKMVRLYSVDGDSLFSSDQDLATWEPDIVKWVSKGRSSFLNIHREAQQQIIYWLDKEGYVNIYNQKYDKFDIVDHSEVNEWASFLALSIIFWGISNKSDDVFLKKHYEYLGKTKDARARAVLRLDVDEDGAVDTGERLSISSGVVVTR